MELEGYSTIPGYECLGSCIMNFFCYEGYALHSYDIPIIGNGLGLRYSERNGIPEIRTGIYEANFCFLNRCKLDYQMGILDLTDAVSFLKRNFKENKRIILRVNASRLSYNKAFRRGNVVQHFINLIGIKGNGSEVKISDGCAPTYHESIYERWVRTDDLIPAWSDMGFAYLLLDFAANQDVSIERYDINDMFYHGMKRNVSSLFHRLMGKGISAIPMFQNKLESKLKCPEPLSQTEMAYVICNHIRIGGMLSMKKMISLYIADKIRNKELMDCYKNSVDIWDTVSLLLLKFSVSKSAEDFISIQSTLKELYELESICLKGILETDTRRGRNA